MILDESPYYYLLMSIYAFASPVILYSIMFWEHVPSILVIMAGLYYLVKYFKVAAKTRYIMICMGLIASSALFRSETLLLLFSLVLVFTYCMLQAGHRRTVLRV